MSEKFEETINKSITDQRIFGILEYQKEDLLLAIIDEVPSNTVLTIQTHWDHPIDVILLFYPNHLYVYIYRKKEIALGCNSYWHFSRHLENSTKATEKIMRKYDSSFIQFLSASILDRMLRTRRPAGNMEPDNVIMRLFWSCFI